MDATTVSDHTETAELHATAEQLLSELKGAALTEAEAIGAKAITTINSLIAAAKAKLQ